MTRPLRYAALLFFAAAVPAMAQTAANPYAATNRGVVTLGNSAAGSTPATIGANTATTTTAQPSSSTATGIRRRHHRYVVSSLVGAYRRAVDLLGFDELGRVGGERHRHGIEQCPDMAPLPAIGRLRERAVPHRHRSFLRPLSGLALDGSPFDVEDHLDPSLLASSLLLLSEPSPLAPP
jgi:hypothetical protein